MSHEEGIRQVLEEICDFPVPTQEEWEKVTEKSLKGRSIEEALFTKTLEGITLKPLYREEDRDKLPYQHTMPGQSPYVRGTEAGKLPSRPWEISQSVSERVPALANQVIKEGLERGQHAVKIEWNEALWEHREISRDNIKDQGVLVTSVDDLLTLLDGIDLDAHPFHVETGPDPLPLFSMWMAAMKKKGATKFIKGSVAADPFGYWVKYGTLPLPLSTCFDHVADVIRWCDEEKVDVKTILVSSEPYHLAGASATEELAYIIATAVTYIKELAERGIEPEKTISHMQFHLPAGANFFMEIAKFRALRVLWSHVQTAYDINEEQRTMTVYGVTSKKTKAKYDPYVNMLRATTEAFSLAAGGVDSVEVTPFDEVFQRPTSFSRRIARNTQIILQEESHLGRTIDPAGGSYYVENITHELGEKAWRLFQDIEADGGFEKALREGRIQTQLETLRKQRKEQVEHQERVYVGVNKYADIYEKPVSVTPESDEKEIVRYFEANNASRIVHNELQDNENKTAQLIEFASENTTLFSQRVACSWKEEQEPITSLPVFREAELFESLRERAEQFKQTKNEPLSALLVGLGPLAHHKARADFAAGFLQTGGFEIEKTDGFDDAETAIAQAVKSKETIIVLCGRDEAYETYGLSIVEGIKKQAPDKTVLLAGQLFDEALWKEKGLDGTIHRHSNVYETLHWLQRVKGAVEQ
ncbi:methylmalonyl-CoA mutase family protein [Aliibacillus thermotolerans]|uniref:methylmalonyl-CoA mutase n=1 Tax=Aliibacillus thermotolerans TaxID=1834418 RepID=A0ABW0U509_9BACI|nr:methylmalonyl-CoA mutase family protein [Aliibacillus thermotolerans]MDA3129221.1 hypothetical protein [Aliibacillus thermotolerans]